jgi:hypothetical protein
MLAEISSENILHYMRFLAHCPSFTPQFRIRITNNMRNESVSLKIQKTRSNRENKTKKMMEDKSFYGKK